MKILVALLLSVFAHVVAFFSVNDDLPPLVFNGGQTAVTIAMNIVDVTTQEAKHKNSQTEKAKVNAVKPSSSLSTNFAGNKIKAKQQKTMQTLAENIVLQKELVKDLVEPVEEILPEEKHFTELVKSRVPAEPQEFDTERKDSIDNVTQAAQLATAKHHAMKLALTNEIFDVAAPSVFKAPRPKLSYPKRAKRRGYQGQALVLIELNATGGIDKLSLSKSSGYQLLDNAALKNVSMWEFNPVLQKGIAIRARFEVPIGFFLT